MCLVYEPMAALHCRLSLYRTWHAMATADEGDKTRPQQMKTERWRGRESCCGTMEEEVQGKGSLGGCEVERGQRF